MARRFVGCALLALAAGGALGTAAQPQRKPAPIAGSSALLLAAQDAVGTRSVPGGIRSLILRGRVQTSPNAFPRTLEVRIVLPDSYLYIETDEYRRLQRGFHHDTILHRLEVLRPGFEARSTVGSGYLNRARFELAYLALGMLADIRASVPFAEEAAQGGEPHQLRLAAPDGSHVLLAVDATSALPSVVRYRVSPPPGLSGGTGALGRAAGERSSTPPASDTIEVTIRFDEWRRVGAAQLPFRIATTQPASHRREIRLDEILINPPLSATDFLQAAQEKHRAPDVR